MNNFDTNSSTSEQKRHAEGSKQFFEKVPSEFLAQPRFFLVREDKVPKTKDWGNPDNQRDYRKIRGLKGFDLSGHGRGVDYLMIDFDHVLNDAGEFIYPDAERWYNFIAQSGDNIFCERSISGHGIHFFAAPTAGKFPKVTNAKKNTIIFDEKAGAKIELFYLNEARYCLVTGNLFRCKPGATIPHGDEADDIFQHLLNTIAKNQPAQETEKKSASKPTTIRHEDSQDYDLFRAQIMLDAIDPSQLGDADWFAVISACKHVGIDYPTVDAWNRQDLERYDERENQIRWDSAKDPSFDIRTLHGIAKRYGYREADARRQWYDLYPQFKPSSNRNISNDTKRELDEAIIRLETLSTENFSADDAYNPENIRAVALAQTYGFAAAAEKFFTVIKTAKTRAKERLKEAESNLITIPDKTLDELNALAEGTDIITLRKYVTREAQTFARAQKEFRREQEEEQAKQRAIKAKTARQERIDENIKKLIEMRAEYQKNPSPELAEKMRNIIFNSCDVTKNSYTGEVLTVKSTIANADLIFTFDPSIDGAIGYDEFQQCDVFLKPTPWRDADCVGKEWSDRDDAQLCVYLRRRYTEFANDNLVGKLTTSYSEQHKFHPVKDYFANLPKWDGVPRAEKLFVKFLRVDDTPFTREVTMNWLTAAIARIFHPGIRYQTALVLHGNQKIGKSYIIERLGGKWYSEIIDNVDDPHAIDAIRNIWIGEFKEMAGLRKAELNAIKSFIERAADNRRNPYDRRATRILRHCVFAITVNDDHFLVDMTGNRRYLILHCNSPKFSYVSGLTDEYISQVWAEVYHHYCEFRNNHSELTEAQFEKALEAKLELSADAQIQGEEIASNYLKDDGMSGEISAFLDTKILPTVIWDLLGKESRRQFFVDDGKIEVSQAELNYARRARGGRNVQKDIDEIDRILHGNNGVLRKTIQFKNEPQQIRFVLFGTSYREHICAAEIFNECFGNDKRKSMTRIHEILPTIDNWNLGKRISHDSAYGNQQKVFYRDNQSLEPTNDDDNPSDNDGKPDEHYQKSFDDFIGASLDLEDPPF